MLPHHATLPLQFHSTATCLRTAAAATLAPQHRGPTPTNTLPSVKGTNAVRHTPIAPPMHQMPPFTIHHPPLTIHHPPSIHYAPSHHPLPSTTTRHPPPATVNHYPPSATSSPRIVCSTIDTRRTGFASAHAPSRETSLRSPRWTPSEGRWRGSVRTPTRVRWLG